MPDISSTKCSQYRSSYPSYIHLYPSFFKKKSCEALGQAVKKALETKFRVSSRLSTLTSGGADVRHPAEVHHGDGHLHDSAAAVEAEAPNAHEIAGFYRRFRSSCVEKV